MYIDVRAHDRGMILPDEHSAILQVIALQKWAKGWNADGKPFGHVMADMRKIDSAIKTKDYAAFKAVQRRGYWRVTLA